MFKNWKAICQIPDTHFMWAMALLDLDSDYGQGIARQLPEYFTTEEQLGPFPLSVLIRKANESYPNKKCTFSVEYLVSNGVLDDFGIPHVEFALNETAVKSWDLPLLPTEIKEEDILCELNSKIGTVVEWQGKKMVMLEYNENTDTACFVPAELIACDR